jgi:hypothetical protein
MGNAGTIALAAISGLLKGYGEGRQNRQEMDLKRQALERQQERDDALQQYQMTQANKPPESVQSFEYLKKLPPNEQALFLKSRAAGSPYLYGVGPGGQLGQHDIRPLKPEKPTTVELDQQAQDAFSQVPPGYQQQLLKEGPDRLISLMGHKDPQVRLSATFVYNKRFGTKARMSRDDQMMEDLRNP